MLLRIVCMICIFQNTILSFVFITVESATSYELEDQSVGSYDSFQEHEDTNHFSIETDISKDKTVRIDDPYPAYDDETYSVSGKSSIPPEFGLEKLFPAPKEGSGIRSANIVVNKETDSEEIKSTALKGNTETASGDIKYRNFLLNKETASENISYVNKNIVTAREKDRIECNKCELGSTFGSRKDAITCDIHKEFKNQEISFAKKIPINKKPEDQITINSFPKATKEAPKMIVPKKNRTSKNIFRSSAKTKRSPIPFNMQDIHEHEVITPQPHTSMKKNMDEPATTLSNKGMQNITPVYSM